MKAAKILSRVGAVITVLVFILGLLIFGTVLKAKEGQVPSILGFSVLKIRTGSMEPEYKTGSIIIAKKVNTDSLKEGDVISFYATGKDIYERVNTHRIEEISYLSTGERQFVTKGDANPTVDNEPVFYKKVIGKVIINLGVFSGSIIGFLQNPTVILIFIVLPLLIITFLEAQNLVKLFMKRDDDPEEEKADEPSEQK
ncbi:MAG: signal peptidase I [Clostridia bacterium]|nr:signal peptidase I [Clostridia bacterium]